jgi:hypothetical protein
MHQVSEDPKFHIPYSKGRQGIKSLRTADYFWNLEYGIGNGIW